MYESSRDGSATWLFFFLTWFLSGLVITVLAPKPKAWDSPQNRLLHIPLLHLERQERMISSTRLCRQRGSLTPKSVFGVPTWTIVLIQEELGQRERVVYFSCPGQTPSGWSCLSSGSVRFEVVTAIVERIGLVPVRLLRLPCGGGHLIIESCIFEAPLFLESGGIAGLPQSFRRLFWLVSGGIWNRTLHSEMFQLVLLLSLQKGQC